MAYSRTRNACVGTWARGAMLSRLGARLRVGIPLSPSVVAQLGTVTVQVNAVEFPAILRDGCSKADGMLWWLFGPDTMGRYSK